MKTKLILIVLLLFSGFHLQAQILEKLKQRAEEKGLKTREVSYDTTDNAKNRLATSGEEELVFNTAKDFFTEDVVMALYTDNYLTQTSFFDANVIAMRTEHSTTAKPIYHDSKGYFYAYNVAEGYYEKASLLPSSLMGFMMAGMVPQAYKLPSEPYLEVFSALEKIDSGLNFLVLEMAFIYKPDHFKENTDYTLQMVSCNNSDNCMRFNYNDVEYTDSYIQFDANKRLVELNIKTTKKFDNQAKGSNGPNEQKPVSGKFIYSYQNCSVKLPNAVERSMIPGPLGKMLNLERGLEPWKHNKKDQQKNKK